MKVVLSESQVLNILNEITSEQRMDFLLDKVAEGGIDSLTPMEKIELRKLSGEEVDSDEEDAAYGEEEYKTEGLEIPDVLEFISDNFPDGITFNIGQSSWEAFIDKEGNEIKISLTDGDRLIDVYPFRNGETKLKVLSTERSPFRVNLEKIPTNMDEAEHFVRSLLNVDIPKIITYVLKTS